MPIALDRIRYFGTQLSENIVEHPNGHLICKNVVIGRSGHQTYQVSEIEDPEKLLAAAGYLPHQSIELWRDPVEVFSPATLSSFETVSFTLSHPSQLLDPDNERDFAIGHIENVRKGSEPLESGEYPIIADIVVKDREGIDAIHSGEREVSCGYRYRLARGPNGWEQRDIRGNHVALVPRGRAGSEARINDSAAPAPKENPVAPVKDFFKHIFGIGFAAYAKDAKPEELSEALDALRTESPNGKTVSTAKDTENRPRFVKIGTTSDGVDIFKSVGKDPETEPEKEGAEDTEFYSDGSGIAHPIRGSKGYSKSKAGDAGDARMRMHDMLDRMMDMSEEEKKAKSEQEKEGAEDVEFYSDGSGIAHPIRGTKGYSKSKAGDAGDARKRMHDMLDRMMDMSEEEKKAKSEQDDADLKELRGIIGDALGEEEEEKPKGEDAAHPEGCRCEDCMDKAKGKDGEAEVVKETADDEAEIVRSEPVLSPEERPESVFDEAKVRAIVAESNLQILKALKPFVAHANDKKLNAAFDTAITRVQAAIKTPAKDKSKGGSAGYSRFRVAASTAKDTADYKPKESAQEKEMREHDALYNKKRIETSQKNAERIGRR
jgi:hypothetical protein